MTTAREVISEALGELGVLDPAETISASDAEFALAKLNTLADAWGSDTSLSFASTETICQLPVGVEFLTIGQGQQIDVATPVRLENAFVRIGGLDYPIRIVDQSTYSTIGVKGLVGPWPAYAWLDGGAPVGKVYFWPLGAGEIHLFTLSQIAPFPDLFADVSLPPGFKAALVYSLAESLSMPYGKTLDMRLIRAASNARRAIKAVVVPQLAIGRRTSASLSGPGLSDSAVLFGIP